MPIPPPPLNPPPTLVDMKPQTQEIVPQPKTEISQWNKQNLDLLKKTLVPPDITDTEFSLFVEVCKRRDLDPFSRQIYAVKRSGKLVIQTSIDGYRLIAERTGKYLGQSAPEWCLPYNAKIETDRGYLKIGDIVQNRLRVRVPSFNQKTKLVEWKAVTDWYFNGSTEDWISLQVKNGIAHPAAMTPEHKILTSKGWVEAGIIQVGDMLPVVSPAAPVEVLVGSLLGDGSLRKDKDNSLPAFSEGHSIKQKDYLLWKMDALGNFKCKLSECSAYVGKDKTRHEASVRFHTYKAASLEELWSEFYPCGFKKVPSDGLLDRMTPLSLAIWFMDDGTVVRHKDQANTSILYTQGFSLEDNLRLAMFLKAKFRLDAKVFNTPDGYIIKFGVKDTIKLMKLIKPYLTYDGKSKLWVANKFERLGMTSVLMPVLNISRVHIGNYGRGRYCVEVEDNHNFIYKNLIVKNCGEDGVWKEVWTGKGNPFACRIGVFKEGMKLPTVAIGYWNTYVAPGPFWTKSGPSQLAKCTEALALRKAFPEDLSGIYTSEEMQQAGDGAIEATIVNPNVPTAAEEQQPVMIFPKEVIAKNKTGSLVKDTNGVEWVFTGNEVEEAIKNSAFLLVYYTVESGRRIVTGIAKE